MLERAAAEPSLADVTTRAKPQADGSYRLHGTKMWISAAHGRESDFFAGKRQACRYFFRWELPKALAQLEALRTLDRSALDMADAWF